MASTVHKAIASNKDISWVGKKFGRLTVISIVKNAKNKAMYWKCKCDCGNETLSQPSQVRALKYVQCKNCAAQNWVRKNPTIQPNQVFGLLTTVGRSAPRKWLCVCVCGKTAIRSGSNLIKSNTPSCDECLVKVQATHNVTHGGSVNGRINRLYNVWSSMKARCSIPSCAGYKYYGGKGIRVCEEWLRYENFCEWALANGYEFGLTIDRLNPDKNYEPSNCEWVTREINAHRVKKPEYIERQKREDFILSQLSAMG